MASRNLSSTNPVVVNGRSLDLDGGAATSVMLSEGDGSGWARSPSYFVSANVLVADTVEGRSGEQRSR